MPLPQDAKPNTQGTGGDPPAAQEARSGGRPTPPRVAGRRDGIDRSGPPPHRRPGKPRMNVYDGTTPPDRPTYGNEPKTGSATNQVPNADDGGDSGI